MNSTDLNIADKAFTVSGLNCYVASMLRSDENLSDLVVTGEISGFKRHTSGHLYFTLKDELSSIRCVMFRQNAVRLSFIPSDGMSVRITGYANLFERDGSFQVYALSMQKTGKGDLFRRFMEMKQQLDDEGYFDPSLKKPVPFLPRRIGIVTSGSGAALQDILTVSRRRFPAMDFVLCPVRVQGEGAETEIAAGIRKLNALKAADVIIVGRGGGSLEDLWAFNEKTVADAIRESDIPIISAVGHETDFTIADFTADLRAPTPSAAAELAVPDITQLDESISSMKRRMKAAADSMLFSAHDRLSFYSRACSAEKLIYRLDTNRMQLDSFQEKLFLLSAHGLKNARGALENLSSRLDSIGPAKVMKRGFAYVSNCCGNPVTSVRELHKSDLITIHLADGTVDSSINKIIRNVHGERRTCEKN